MKNHIVVFISQQYDWWKLVVDVTTLKMARKLVKLQKENPAGYAGEGKQNKENQEKRKGRYKDNLQYHYVRNKVSQV